MAQMFDAQTVSSTLAFVKGELERVDPQLYLPIEDATWGRDIETREDVAFYDEVSSFILANFAGGFGGTGIGKKSWITNGTTTPAQVGVGAKKVMSPMTPWGMEVSFSIRELMAAMAVGRPIDVQKFDALRIKHQLDIDEQVYVGDSEIGVSGLLNNPDVTVENLGVIDKSTSVADIIDMFAAIMNDAWKVTGYTRMPDRILVPPAVYARLVATQLTNTNENLLNYLQNNNLRAQTYGTELKILPVKWLGNEDYFSTPRIVAYTKARDVVRFPLVRLQALPVQHRDYFQIVPYYGALGAVEFVRPEMVYYGDLAAVESGSGS